MNSSRTRFQEDTGWTGFRQRAQHLILSVVDHTESIEGAEEVNADARRA